MANLLLQEGGPTLARIEPVDLHSPSAVIAALDSHYELDYSISEFKRNLRELLADL